MRTIEERLERDSAEVRRRIGAMPTRPLAVVRIRARRQRFAMAVAAFVVVLGGFSVTNLFLAGGPGGSVATGPAAPGGTSGQEATPGDSISTGTTFDGSVGACSPTVTRGTLYLGGPAEEDNLAATGFIFSVTAGSTATDLARSFVSRAIVGDGCEQHITASTESSRDDGQGVVAVVVVPPATPDAVRLTVETASQNDIIGVTRVRGVTFFSVTANDGGAILHLDALPAEAVTVSVRFRKGEDVWELAATANDQEIPLVVPAGETDRFPDAQPEWVLFTVQDRNGALLDVGGTLIP